MAFAPSQQGFDERDEQFISESTDLATAAIETVARIEAASGARLPQSTVMLMHLAFVGGVVWQTGRDVDKATRDVMTDMPPVGRA